MPLFLAWCLVFHIANENNSKNRKKKHQQQQKQCGRRIDLVSKDPVFITPILNRFNSSLSILGLL